MGVIQAHSLLCENVVINPTILYGYYVPKIHTYKKSLITQNTREKFSVSVPTTGSAQDSTPLWGIVKTPSSKAVLYQIPEKINLEREKV